MPSATLASSTAVWVVNHTLQPRRSRGTSYSMSRVWWALSSVCQPRSTHDIGSTLCESSLSVWPNGMQKFDAYRRSVQVFRSCLEPTHTQQPAYHTCGGAFTSLMCRCRDMRKKPSLRRSESQRNVSFVNERMIFIECIEGSINGKEAEMKASGLMVR